jgi:uncharacterized membrane protein
MSSPQESQPAAAKDASGSKQQPPFFLPSPTSPGIQLKQGEDAASQQTASVLQIQSQLIAESFSGPLPHPDILAKFEQVMPGLAGRIMKMAEKQSAHRQSLETTVVNSDVRRAWAGLWTGFVIGMTGIIGGVILGLFGQTALSGLFGGAALVSLAAVFVHGTKSRREERTNKAKLMTGAAQPRPENETPTSLKGGAPS